MAIYTIHPDTGLSIDDLSDILRQNARIELSPESIQRIERARSYLDKSRDTDLRPVYGINTGFGALCNTIINEDQLSDLQHNVLLSHACGAGEEVPAVVVKLMLLLKVHSLALGHSGVSLSTVTLLVEMFNRNVLPVVYQQGSLGASGDLAPLAHLSIPLIGEGYVRVNGRLADSASAFREAGLDHIRLKSKEGLALINGTQFMSAYLAHILIEGGKLMHHANEIAALSLEAFMGSSDPFHPLLHAVRPHNGQIRVAAQFREILAGSPMQEVQRENVQDPYSFRCIPQVHGASLDAMEFAKGVLETEINSVTDNPVIFPDEEMIISGGNFHGQPLALALDFLALALAELGSISERRTYKLLSGQRGLPVFLAVNPGLNSGFMICQYTAASIVSQNKQLCMPASADTIDSSNGQEDHVSMGANAATKCLRVLENLRTVESIEWLCAAQAFEFRRPLVSSDPIEKRWKVLRDAVPFASSDIYMKPVLDKVRELLS